MAITGEDAARIVAQHALGGTPINRTETGAADASIELANDAGRWMMNARKWKWASGARATLGVTASQSYITLPADFAEFIGQPTQTASFTGGFEWVSLETLTQVISESPNASSSYFLGALSYDTSGAGAPVAQIELYPTPDTTNASAFTVFYERTWFPLPDPADSTAAKIPVFMEGVYTATLEAYARGWEDSTSPDRSPGTRQAYLAEVMAGEEWSAACRRDQQQQPHYGVIKNGLLGSRYRHWSRVQSLDAPA